MSQNPYFVWPRLHMDRDHHIQSNFWKFHLVRTNFMLGESVYCVDWNGFFWRSECGHSQ
jgi:hypothetical protein